MFACAYTRMCATGRMLRHGNGPGRQVWTDPKLSILRGTRHRFRRVKGSLRGVRTRGWSSSQDQSSLSFVRRLQSSLCLLSGFCQGWGISICSRWRVGPLGGPALLATAQVSLRRIGVEVGGSCPCLLSKPKSIILCGGSLGSCVDEERSQLR